MRMHAFGCAVAVLLDCGGQRPHGGHWHLLPSPAGPALGVTQTVLEGAHLPALLLQNLPRPPGLSPPSLSESSFDIFWGLGDHRMPPTPVSLGHIFLLITPLVYSTERIQFYFSRVGSDMSRRRCAPSPFPQVLAELPGVVSGFGRGPSPPPSQTVCETHESFLRRGLVFP